MSKSEARIEAIRILWEEWQEEGLKDLNNNYSLKEKCRSAMKTRLILLCYGAGYPVKIIAYSLKLTVHSIYRRLNSDPIYYEEMKALRKTKMRENADRAHASN